MEFEIEQSKLLSALSLAQTVADRRSTMPVLANVLMRATKDGKLVCSATDMMIALTESVPAEVMDPGVLALDVRHLHSVVRTLPDRPIRIKGLDNHWAQLTVGRSEFKFMGMTPGDFPELPDGRGLAFTRVMGHALADMIQKTQFSVSTDEARVNLNGVLFECDGETATMVSTDGHRLTKYTVPLTGPKLASGIIIPRKGMLELRKVLDRVDAEVELAVDDQHVFLQTESLLLSVKLNNVTFPPYKQVIPGQHKRRVTALRDELVDVLRRAEVMAPEKTATVRLELGEHRLTLTADNPDRGVARQEIEIEYDGDRLVAGFNARYLIEVLEAIDTPKVHLDFQGELDPCVVRPVEGPDFLGVVMPMRI
ncbi:MAG: DNA polymerase III subunit beta [Myxococcales bacterium]|nr:DNA polymerase III subunit beta [Myxococcales bacterium]MCB9566763.1 DNA polymerase III subunit beta [Myxococcales bacterium]MCB9704499.1 DNA polymerase III subunit beta [Myxococcales bacterium]